MRDKQNQNLHCVGCDTRGQLNLHRHIITIQGWRPKGATKVALVAGVDVGLDAREDFGRRDMKCRATFITMETQHGLAWQLLHQHTNEHAFGVSQFNPNRADITTLG